MEKLRGKKAIITGGTKGIGFETAIALAKEGVDLGLIARTEADLKEAAKQLAEYDVGVATAAADISSNEDVVAAVDALKGKLGTFDILVNNAGIAKFGTILEQDVADWERMIKVNLLGMYYVTRAVLPTLVEKNTGDIINISSTAGERSGAGMSAYSASKFGVLGFSEALMQEARKHNIRVTALTPSTVVTDLAINEGLVKGDEEHVLQPEDLAELIVSHLKLNRRVFVKTAGLWTTNP